ncbi:DUF2637 domain-containing protein [Kitasatospora indigofera]|uniref:DUF2637 domain-containing protein n=1 Tax=Kitasatospora indigofera TaxID=67307 RepID=UPI00368F92B7
MRRDHSSRLAAAAAAVIGLLTGSAFWLSYAHLHTVAAEHGLGGSEARAWAWPGCLDLFIVAGELLMLRASLSRRTDWWAIALTVVGSGGSIALNIAGVAGSDPLDYVVAAVPPTAALLAFGALMRQVHDALSDSAGQTALSTAETPADQAFPAIAETGMAADQPFSRVRENAPAAGHGRPLIGPVRDGLSLTEGHHVPLSVERDTLSPSEVPSGPLSVGSLGDLTNGEGTHRVSTPGAEKGLHSAETPEVPSAVVTEFVTERPSTAMDAPDHLGGAATKVRRAYQTDTPAAKGVHTAHTPGGNRGDTPTDALDAVEATADAPHPAASDAASGHPDGQPLAAEQQLPEVPSAGRTEPVLDSIPWPGLDGASVHPALHPAASGADQSAHDHSTGAREVITDGVSAADPIPEPDGPEAHADANASEAALIATARAVDQAARAETGRAASLRRLQAELRIGQPRAQQLQRILANA